MEKLNKCLLCAGASFLPAEKREEYQYVRCSGCGLIFVNPRDDSEEAQAQYALGETSPVEHYLNTAHTDAWTFERRLNLVEAALSEQGRRMLDVGCSVGTFMELARATGWEVLGIEANSKAVAHARGSSLKVVHGFFCDEEGQLGKEGLFDMINMGEVIEHFSDPMAALLVAGRLLKSGGVLALSTPAYESCLARLFQMKPKEHLFIFSRKTIRRALEETGFETDSIMRTTRRRDISHMMSSPTFSGDSFKARVFSLVFRVFTGLGLSRLMSYTSAHLVKDELFVIARKR